MSLYDHLSEGGNYLRDGNHICTIKRVEFFNSTKGTRGVKFHCASAGAITNIAFWITEKALPILAAFAKAAGVSDAQMKRIDTEAERGFEVFINLTVGIVVVQNGQYYQGDKFFAPNAEPPVAPAPRPELQTQATEGPSDDDGIPF